MIKMTGYFNFELEEIFEAFKETEACNCLVTTTHPELTQILYKAIIDFDLAGLKGIRRCFLSQIDYSGMWPLIDKPMLIISYPNTRSVKQIKNEKKILEFLYNQSDKKKMILLHSLEHPLLVNSLEVYPDKMLYWMLKDKKKRSLWKRYIVPKNPWANTSAAKISLRRIGQKEEWKKMLFNTIASCLYPPDQYSQVQKLKNFKNNVFLVKVKFKDINLASRYEVIKIDSMRKIKKEKDNFDVVKTNLTGGKLYQVMNTVSLYGEFAGAIRSCAESSIDLKMFKVMSLRDLLVNKPEPGMIKKILCRVNDCLDAIYGLEHRNQSEPAFPIYRNRIIPAVMDILIPFGLNQIHPADPGSKISKLMPDFKAIGTLDNDKCFIKIVEILPDMQDIDLCTLFFEVEDSKGKTFLMRCLHRSPGWRESFIKLGLSPGQIVLISRMKQKGYLFQLFEVIKELNIAAGVSPADKKEKGDRNRLKERTTKIDPKQMEIRDLKTFINKPRLFLSIGSPPVLKHRWNPLYLLERFSGENDLLLKEVTGPAHGDLNLDNILIYMEDENKIKMVEPSNENTNNVKKEDEEPEVRLIDLASFATDYPLSFDYVKLEVEIKNHVLARPDFINLGDDFSSQEDKGKFVDFVFRFENKLWESGEQNDWPEEWPDFVKPYVNIIKEIRKHGQARYQSNVEDAAILYQQQLFFYSLRTLTYRKVSKWAKLWAFLAAVVAADHLDLAE
jgi:hypothetical protein